MSSAQPLAPKPEETPVDDVRRVRRKLSEETGGDMNRLADHARKTTEKLLDQLGLKRTRRN